MSEFFFQGILLAHDKSGVKAGNFFNQSNQLTSVYAKNQDALKRWQDRVRKNPEEFVDMFEDMKLVPDILGLHEWANWVTPSWEKRRFDTMFFTCFLSRFPESSSVLLDQNEIESCKVS